MEAVRELAHTADVGFELEAPTAERLFELAARGLSDVLGARPGGGAGIREEVALERADPERLLVAWLRVLLDGSTSREAVPGRVRVRIPQPGRLRAVVEWLPWSNQGPSREIKGVTYHDLQVARDDSGAWHGRVVLDV
jgi:SHS2 domain-containing protein